LKNRWSRAIKELDPVVFGTIQTCEALCVQLRAAENGAVPMGAAHRSDFKFPENMEKPT
jgi:hypothetical protein